MGDMRWTRPSIVAVDDAASSGSLLERLLRVRQTEPDVFAFRLIATCWPTDADGLRALVPSAGMHGLAALATALVGLRHPRGSGLRVMPGRRMPSWSRSSSTRDRPARSIFLRASPSSLDMKTPPTPVKPVRPHLPARARPRPGLRRVMGRMGRMTGAGQPRCR
jgi:hypothetical protein